jgi:uncharacterized protein (DUF1778 family)
MLIEFAALETDNPRGFDRVTQLIAHLMRNQFVHTDDRGSAAFLETLHRPELNKLVGSYFDVAGYRLVHRESEGWAGILPDPERIALPRMRIEETVALLVLRRLWEQELQLGGMAENATIRTTLNEAYAAYQDIVAGSRRAALSVGDFREILRTLEKRSIVRLGELDPEAYDMELDIRALVTTVAGDDFVASLEQILTRPVPPPAGPDDPPETGDEA